MYNGKNENYIGLVIFSLHFYPFSLSCMYIFLNRGINNLGQILLKFNNISIMKFKIRI